MDEPDFEELQEQFIELEADYQELAAVLKQKQSAAKQQALTFDQLNEHAADLDRQYAENELLLKQARETNRELTAQHAQKTELLEQSHHDAISALNTQIKTEEAKTIRITHELKTQRELNQVLKERNKELSTALTKLKDQVEKEAVKPASLLKPIDTVVQARETDARLPKPDSTLQAAHDALLTENEELNVKLLEHEKWIDELLYELKAWRIFRKPPTDERFLKGQGGVKIKELIQEARGAGEQGTFGREFFNYPLSQRPRYRQWCRDFRGGVGLGLAADQAAGLLSAEERIQARESP